jgi:hypothetical protein
MILDGNGQQANQLIFAVVMLTVMITILVPQILVGQTIDVLIQIKHYALFALQDIVMVLVTVYQTLVEHSTAQILLPIQLEMTAQMFGVIINIMPNALLEVVYGLLRIATIMILMFVALYVVGVI